MSEHKRKLAISALIIVALLVITSVIIWAFTQPDENMIVSDISGKPNVVHVDSYSPEQTETQNTTNDIMAETSETKDPEADEQMKPLTGEQRRSTELIPDSKIPAGATLAQIIEQRKTWSPNLEQWYGKDAPDFTLKDLDGKEHKLSDYKGRNALVIFWATWCPPCKMEIPHLILMEKRIPQDKLKILAITNEDTKTVRKFVSDMGINYTVLLDRGSMPNLYRAIPSSGIPSAAFINPEGKVKLITVGYVSYEETQAILQAKK